MLKKTKATKSIFVVLEVLLGPLKIEESSLSAVTFIPISLFRLCSYIRTTANSTIAPNTKSIETNRYTPNAFRVDPEGFSDLFEYNTKIKFYGIWGAHCRDEYVYQIIVY